MALTIVGRGDIGSVFLRCARAAGEEPRVVVRGEDPAKAALGEGPLVIAVRETDLAPMIEPLSAKAIAGRLVFVQNGFIDQIIGPIGQVTRGLLWFNAKGDFFRALAPSIFHGPFAAAAAALLEAGGVPAKVEADRAAFQRAMIVKLAWNNVVGLPLAVHQTTLGEYLASSRDEARAVVAETCLALGRELGVEVDPSETFRTLLDTTAELAENRGGKKALAFRNGAVVRLAEKHGLPAPVNDRLLTLAERSYQ
jgi:hypothetical protein